MHFLLADRDDAAFALATLSFELFDVGLELFEMVQAVVGRVVEH